ncbi:MAG: hypothetical protein ABF311_05490 [Polaribacter sp.]
MKSHKQLLEEFLSFEDKYNLFDLEIDSVPIWELIRTSVFSELSSKLVNKTVINRNEKEKSKVKLFSNILYNIIFKNPFLTFKKKDILFLNHPRRKFNKGFYEDIYIESLLPELNNNFLVLEGFVNYNITHFKPVNTCNLFYLDIIQFSSNILSKKIRYKLSLNNLEVINKIESNIFDLWGVKIKSLRNEIPVLIKRWKYSTKLVALLLKKIKPKLLVNVVSYSFLNQVFNFVSKQKGIPVVELQHGTVGRYHINYNYKKGKEITLKTFPNYFLSWGLNWTKNSRLPLNSKEIIATGYPYINSFRNQKNVKKNPKQLVFISQVREDIAFFVERVAQILPDFKIVFKAHPAEYSIAKEKYSSILRSENIQLIVDDEKKIYQIFSESYAVFGVNSTALVEALAFCPKVGVVKLPGWEYFEDIEESINFTFVNSPEKLKLFITKPANDISKVSNYFLNNAKSNIIEFIKTKTD